MSIALPKDAEGREIPLDTTTLYTVDGTQCDVSHFTYYPKCKITEQSWHIVFTSGLIKRASQMYLTLPDSWEKLLEDLGMVEDYVDTYALNGPACIYMHNADKSCDTCKLYGDAPCVSKMCADIADRIRKLRGEDE